MQKPLVWDSSLSEFDYETGALEIVSETPYSKGERAKVKCYGADDVREGAAINHHEGVDVSITGNSTNPARFQHPVAGTYKKECPLKGKKFFRGLRRGLPWRLPWPWNRP